MLTSNTITSIPLGFKICCFHRFANDVLLLARSGGVLSDFIVEKYMKER